VARSTFVCVMWSLGSFGCVAAPDMTAVTEQALADGRASLAVLAVAVPPATPGPREPSRMQPQRTEGMPAASEARAASSVPAAGMPIQAAALFGSPPERVLAWLGEPALRRAEGPAAIWLYSNASCQLDVMFYPSADGPRVAHAQARAGGFAQRTEAACLQDLAAQARRRASPASPVGRVGGDAGMLG
jgi:hypothetical protein